MIEVTDVTGFFPAQQSRFFGICGASAEMLIITHNRAGGSQLYEHVDGQRYIVNESDEIGEHRCQLEKKLNLHNQLSEHWCNDMCISPFIMLNMIRIAILCTSSVSGGELIFPWRSTSSSNSPNDFAPIRCIRHQRDCSD